MMNVCIYVESYSLSNLCGAAMAVPKVFGNGKTVPSFAAGAELTLVLPAGLAELMPKVSGQVGGEVYFVGASTWRDVAADWARGVVS